MERTATHMVDDAFYELNAAIKLLEDANLYANMNGMFVTARDTYKLAGKLRDVGYQLSRMSERLHIQDDGGEW